MNPAERISAVALCPVRGKGGWCGFSYQHIAVVVTVKVANRHGRDRTLIKRMVGGDGIAAVGLQ